MSPSGVPPASRWPRWSSDCGTSAAAPDGRADAALPDRSTRGPVTAASLVIFSGSEPTRTPSGRTSPSASAFHGAVMLSTDFCAPLDPAFPSHGHPPWTWGPRPDPPTGSGREPVAPVAARSHDAREPVLSQSGFSSAVRPVEHNWGFRSWRWIRVTSSSTQRSSSWNRNMPYWRGSSTTCNASASRCSSGSMPSRQRSCTTPDRRAQRVRTATPNGSTGEPHRND